MWVNFKSKMLSFSEASSNCCYQYFYGINFTTKTTPMPTYNLYEIRYRSLRVTVEQIFAVYRSRSRFLPRTVQAWQRWICYHLPTKHCTRYSCHTLYNTFFIVWTWWWHYDLTLMMRLSWNVNLYYRQQSFPGLHSHHRCPWAWETCAHQDDRTTRSFPYLWRLIESSFGFTVAFKWVNTIRHITYVPSSSNQTYLQQIPAMIIIRFRSDIINFFT